jgi:hypothetical protein
MTRQINKGSLLAAFVTLHALSQARKSAHPLVFGAAG